MKKLLSLLALIAAAGAASAYAENQAGAAPAALAAANPAPAQAVAPAAKPAAAPAPAARVVIALNGQPKSVAALLAELEQDAVYKNAACSLPQKPGKAATIVCAKGDSGLMALLLHSNAGTVRWTVSGATAAPKAMAVQSPTISTMSTTSTTCQKQTCGGFTSCFLPKCGAACTGTC